MNVIKYLSLFVVVLCALGLQAKFNPTNPDEPGEPKTTYRLEVGVTPAGAGSTNVVSNRYEPGTMVRLTANTWSGYKFDRWTDISGETLSTEPQFMYEMPAAHTSLTAHFKYSPDSPEEPAEYATVKVTVNPSNAGTVSGAGSYTVGSTVRITFNSNQNYKFKNFTVGDMVIETRQFDYVVKSSGNNIVANAEYNPENPDDPSGTNSMHTLMCKASPTTGGTVNISKAGYSAGDKVSVEVSPAYNHTLTSWTDETGTVISTSNKFNFTMPNRSTTLMANLKYNPSNPGEPTTETPRRNIIYGSRRTIQPGATVFYDVLLENVDAVTGVNVDVTIPDVLNADFDNLVSGTRTGSPNVSVQDVDATTKRVIIRSAEQFDGANGAIFSIPVKVPADAQPGSIYTIGLAKGVYLRIDGSQGVTDPNEGAIRVADETITLPNSPDFRITKIRTPGGTLMPGDELDVNWEVSNAGEIAANGGWKEIVSLMDADGRTARLGSLFYDANSVAVGEKVARGGRFTIPSLPGVDGELNVSVSLVPFASSGEIDQYKVNNSAATDNTPVKLGKVLSFEIADKIYEGTDKSVRGRLSRSGSWKNSETFNISGSVDSRLTLPATVVIPKEQSAAFFTIEVADNDDLDESSLFTIKATGNGYPDTKAEVDVTDDEYPDIDLALSKERMTEGESVTLTVKLPKATVSDLAVILSSDTPGRFKFPSTVTIPSGAKSVDVEIKAIDNDKIENTVDVSFFATASHYGKGEAYIYLDDNDMPALELEVSPTTVSEGSGPRAIRAVLRRKSNPNTRAEILLSDNKGNTLIYDKKLILEKGVEQMDFNIGVVDNAIVDGDRDVTLTAAVFLQSCSCSAKTESGGAVTANFTIIDNDGPSLGINMTDATLRRDKTSTSFVVTRNTKTDEPLTVKLIASPAGLLELPAEVTIPEGKDRVKVEVNAPTTSFSGSEQVITMTAQCDGYSRGTGIMLISDKTLPDAIVTFEIDNSEELLPKQKFQAKATVTNIGNMVMQDAVPVDLIVNGNSVGTWYTTKVLEPGQSETIDMEIVAPKIPGTYKYMLNVNNSFGFEELTRTNNSTETYMLNVKSPFMATVDVNGTKFSGGEKVTVSGLTSGYTDEIEVYYITSGARRSVITKPDSNGRFSVEIDPQFAGDYNVGVCVPGEDKKDSMAQFSVMGVQLLYNGYMNYQMELGASKTLTMQIVNASSEPLAGIQYLTPDKPAECEVKVTGPESLAGHETADVIVELTAKGVTEGTNWQEFSLIAKPEQGTSAAKTLHYYGRLNRAALVADVNTINTTVTVGTPRIYQIKLGNKGTGPTGDITLSLPPIMKSGTTVNYPSIVNGENLTVDLVITPTSDMQLNLPVTGNIGINCANGNGISIPFEIELVSQSTGKLIVDVKDEYTFYTAEKPHVADADVLVLHPVSGKLIASGKTGEDGTWSTTLPEGYYTLQVSADKHTSKVENILLSPGRDNEHPVFLPFEAITYNWSVEETNVDDEYNIVTTVDYETRVPKPVVLVEYPELNFRNEIVYVTVTNKGLVKATGVKVEFETEENEEEIKFTILGDEIIDELLPGETVQVPVLVWVVQDNLYPPFKTAMGENGSVTGSSGSSSPNKSPILDRFFSCKTVKAVTYVDEYECDPITGEPYFTGKKIPGYRYYRTGECGGGWIIKDWNVGGPNTGPDPDFPVVENTALQRRLLIWLIYGCTSDCEKGILHIIKKGWETISTCTGIPGPPEIDLGGPSLEGSIGDFVEQATEDTDFPISSDCVSSVLDGCDFTEWESVHDAIGCIDGAAGDCGAPPGVECGISFIAYLSESQQASETCEDMWEYYDETGGPKDGWPSPWDLDRRDSNNGDESKAPRMKSTNYGTVEEPPRSEESLARIKREQSVIQAYKYFGYYKLTIANLLGDGNWNRMSSSEMKDMFRFVTENCDENGYVVTGEAALAGKPVSVDVETYNNFLERFNNTVLYEKTGQVSENMRDPEIQADINAWIEEFQKTLNNLGYDNYDQYRNEVKGYLKDYVELDKEEDGSGMCSSISMEFNQTMVMTRQAFRGKFSMTNGNENATMEFVNLQMRIRDSEGNLVGDKLFAIEAESLNGFEGDLEVGAEWRLKATETGEATFLFIPSKDAAPIDEQIYSFGAVLSYGDPFTGKIVTRELTPVEMTVKPCPILDLDYFMQRDVMGDDPMTEDVIEPTEAAEFALLIRNKGYGPATSLQMTTAQPVIVDNAKGLAIDFRIAGSSLDGSAKTMSIGDKIPTVFGDLGPQATTYAQWWMESSLMGHFNKYNVEATQVSSYGSEEMSLLDNVRIHELIHGMTNSTNSASRLFLVNDVDDALHAPDMMWDSYTGDYEDVSVTTKGIIYNVNSNGCTLEVQAADGWTYGSVKGDWTDHRKVVGVKRLSDGKEFPADNVWITNSTLSNSSAPVHEKKLYFAFKLNGNPESYHIQFETVPEVQLKISEVAGLPESDKVSMTPVEKIEVVLNKAVNAETFNTGAMSLQCGDRSIDISRVIISETVEPELAHSLDKVEASGRKGCAFGIAFGDATASSGHYTLLFDMTKIEDTDGYHGSEPVAVSWTQLADGKVEVKCYAEPAEGGSTSISEKRVDYKSTVKVSASANEGYVFSRWSKNGVNVNGGANDYSFAPDSDTELIAHFSRMTHWVDVECDENHGTIVGSRSGIYEHGTKLSMVAVPSTAYKFDKWVDANEEPVSMSPELEMEVKADGRLRALFSSVSTGIEDMKTDSGSTYVYPKVVRNKLNVGGAFELLKSIEIVDSNGLRHRSITGYEKGMPVNVEALTPGVYIVRVVTDIDVTVHKIVKL